MPIGTLIGCIQYTVDLPLTHAAEPGRVSHASSVSIAGAVAELSVAALLSKCYLSVSSAIYRMPKSTKYMSTPGIIEQVS